MAFVLQGLFQRTRFGGEGIVYFFKVQVGQQMGKWAVLPICPRARSTITAGPRKY